MNYREIIESRYNREKWQGLLHDIFSTKVTFWQQPQRVPVDESMAKSAYYMGKITLPDGHTIAIYEVELSDNVIIERNRAGIRNLLCTNWRGMGCSGAFMFCFRQQEAVLRFSYVSEAFTFAEDGSLKKDSTDTKRFTYLLGEGHRSRTAILQFEKLKASGLTLKDITKAFSVEALSDLFFKEYKKQYEDIIEFVTGKRMVKVANKWEERITGEPCREIMQEFAQFPDAEKAVRDYVKKLMGRLVFIQFLQKKGWMGCSAGEAWNDGDKEFVQNLFANTTHKNTFVDDVLEPLFNDINTRRPNDIANAVLGVGIKVPYLNGGLFEHDDYDKTAFPLPAKYMKNLLDFFASYNFTIDENDPDDAEIGVDPEMLGRIFENLLEDNKDKGAFYTPKEIVQYMCRESLIAYLQTDEEDDAVKLQIREFVTTNNAELLSTELSQSIDQKLKDVKICDPAIGSGAFPMGLLRELYACRKAIEGIDDKTAVRIKTEIIQNNIYGVDIEKGAVDIARLRFWLALIVDEKDPHALPNMDFKIMQGNSLLEQYEGVELSGMSLDEQKKKKTKKGDAYQTSFAFDEQIALENIQKAIKQYYLTDNHESKINLRNTIDNNVKSYILNLKGCTPDIQRKLENLPIPNNQFFLWHIYFKEVFDKGGFDIVIGNPPYGLINKRQNQGEGVIVPEKILNVYKSSSEFTPAKGGMLNIFRLFVVHGGTLLKTNGIFCEIFPLAFTCDLSSAKLRQHIMNNYSILNIEAFPERDNPLKRVFASAKMSVCILTFANKKNENNPFALRINREPFVEENKVKSYYTASQIKCIDNKNYTIPLTETSDSNLLIKIYSHSFPFCEVGKCYTGEIDMTFCKKAFTTNPEDAKMLRGAHVDRYIIRNEISQGEVFYLDSEKLFSLKKSLNKELFASPRIIMQGITGVNEKTRLKMTLVKDTFCANSVNYCLFDSLEEARFILALFNSKILNYVFKLLSTNSNVNGYEVDNLPIPRTVSNSVKATLSNLVESILNAKETNLLADTSAEEREIDHLVYDLYGLTEDEIAIVEGTK